MEHNLFINQLINGERRSVELFVNENQKKIFSVCLGYVQNEHDAADLTQEVFIKAFEKLHQYKGDSKLSTWLIRIAINLSINYLRDNKKRTKHLDIQDISIATNQKDSLVTKEIKSVVRKAIYRLPEKQQKVFILNFYLDLSYNEINEITSFSVSSIESLLFRARKNLREYLKDFYSELTD